MENKLKRIVNPRPQNTAQKPAVKKLMDLPLINICYISAVGFYQNLVQPDTIAFITSLYKINKLIEEKKALAYNQLNGKETKLMDKELIDQKLPYQYKEFKKIFFKAASNTLPPHQPYDYFFLSVVLYYVQYCACSLQAMALQFYIHKSFIGSLTCISSYVLVVYKPLNQVFIVPQ